MKNKRRKINGDALFWIIFSVVIIGTIWTMAAMLMRCGA